jgi:hypothetical protein
MNESEHTLSLSARLSAAHVCVCAEQQEEDFAREKEDVMKEIEVLELEADDSVPLSEGILRSPSMANSRDMGSFQSIPGLAHSVASASYRSLQQDVDHSGQSLSQALTAHMTHDQNGSVR